MYSQSESDENSRLSRTSLYWPAVVAGAFLALTIFLISGVLARACGIEFTFLSAHSAGQDAGAIIWGGIAALIAFGLGSLLAVRIAAYRGVFAGLLNGVMVWAVAVPILFYWLGSAVGPMLGKSIVAERAFEQTTFEPDLVARTASDRISADNTAAPDQRSAQTPEKPHHMSRSQASAWWMLVSLAAGLIGACLSGSMGGMTPPVSGTTPANPRP